MEIGIIIRFIVLLLLLLLSAFFSSAETALTTVNRIKMQTMAEEGNRRAHTVLKITADSSKMLSAVLIGNNVVNLSASSLATTLAIDLLGSVGAGVATGILTLLILIFGEISPKTLATLNAARLSLAYAPVIWALMYILTPVIAVVNWLSMGFLRLLRVDPGAGEAGITEEELRTLVDVSHESGAIGDEEKEFIHKMFELTDAAVKEVMIPRIDMEMVDVNWPYEKLLEVFRQERHTRMPVYEENSDNIIGIINMKDLLLMDRDTPFSIRDYLRDAYFTYERKNAADLLDEMRGDSINITIVLDEYGAVAGMVTLEDLLEELVGEIRDEYDANEEDDLICLGEREYQVQGSMNLEDLCQELHLNFVSEDYDTIGGYLTGLLDHFPEAGETYITSDGVILRVDEADKKRVARVHLILPDPSETDEP